MLRQKKLHGDLANLGCKSNSEPMASGLSICGGRYESLEIHRGGFSKVHKARSINGLIVAVKEVSLKESGFKSLDLASREFRVGSNLSHASLLSYYESMVDESSGVFYLVRGWAEGKSLSDLFASGHRFTDGQITEIARRLCVVVDYLHSQNPPVVHRDIKPANLVVDFNGSEISSFKLIDFGAVPSNHASDQMTTHFYSPGFSAPESLAAPNVKSDIFSIGATLLYLKTGKSADDIYDASKAKYVIPPEITGSLRIVLSKTLVSSTDGRFSDANQLIRALDHKPTVSKARVGFFGSAFLAIVAGVAAFNPLSSSDPQSQLAIQNAVVSPPPIIPPPPSPVVLLPPPTQPIQITQPRTPSNSVPVAPVPSCEAQSPVRRFRNIRSTLSNFGSDKERVDFLRSYVIRARLAIGRYRHVPVPPFGGHYHEPVDYLESLSARDIRRLTAYITVSMYEGVWNSTNLLNANTRVNEVCRRLNHNTFGDCLMSEFYSSHTSCTPNSEGLVLNTACLDYYGNPLPLNVLMAYPRYLGFSDPISFVQSLGFVDEVIHPGVVRRIRDGRCMGVDPVSQDDLNYVSSMIIAHRL